MNIKYVCGALSLFACGLFQITAQAQETTPFAPADAAAAPSETTPAPAAAPVQPAPVAPQAAPSTSAAAPALTVDTSLQGSEAEPEVQNPATGLLIQGRMQTQQGILSFAGGPGFLLGYQAPKIAFGLGVSLTRIGIDSDEGRDKESLSGSLFQVTPTILIDVWQSKDGKARANLVGSIGYGTASLTSESENCYTDFDGSEYCDNDENEASATIIPVTLGLGGDYFLGRNFAIGAEAGIQAMFISGLESNGDKVSGGGDTQFAYGLIRASFILGD